MGAFPHETQPICVAVTRSWRTRASSCNPVCYRVSPGGAHVNCRSEPSVASFMCCIIFICKAQRVAADHYQVRVRSCESTSAGPFSKGPDNQLRLLLPCFIGIQAIAAVFQDHSASFNMNMQLSLNTQSPAVAARKVHSVPARTSHDSCAALCNRQPGNSHAAGLAMPGTRTCSRRHGGEEVVSSVLGCKICVDHAHDGLGMRGTDASTL